MPTILDDHRAQHPPTFRDIFRRYRPPTALELATSSLEQCRRDYLDAAHKAEAYAADVKMLREREARLQKEVARLSKLPSPPHVVNPTPEAAP